MSSGGDAGSGKRWVREGGGNGQRIPQLDTRTGARNLITRGKSEPEPTEIREDGGGPTLDSKSAGASSREGTNARQSQRVGVVEAGGMKWLANSRGRVPQRSPRSFGNQACTNGQGNHK